MSESYLAAKSLAFRANLAKLVSPLRRVRPKRPFYELPAHRIPTLWYLYRGLLRNSPTEDVRTSTQCSADGFIERSIAD